MRGILATDGTEFLVDDDKYEELAAHNWTAEHRPKGKCYAITIFKFPNGRWRPLRMHRLITSAGKGQQVDHWDKNTRNNQLSNLRVCTHGQNQHNRGKTVLNKSGYKGVFYERRRRHWVAKIMNGGKSIHLGSFSSAEDAARAYDQAASELHAEFAWLNFPK